MTLALATSLGCNQPPPEGPVPQAVQGSVIYQGKPASGFRVTFHPRSDIGPRQFAPSAITGPDGTFTLTSYHAGDGAPVGRYAVTIEWPQEIATGDEYDAKPKIDRLQGRYASPAKSVWIVDVVEGENQLTLFRIP
jgi:hypothetical protein